MPLGSTVDWSEAWVGLGHGGRLRAVPLADGVEQLRLDGWASRRLGLTVTPLLLDDGTLIDTGFAHVGPLLLARLARTPPTTIVLTHHHEDHTGNAAALQARQRVPLYLASPAERDSEGVGHLPPYRRLTWGAVRPYHPEPMPEVVQGVRRSLRAVPTPGHCCTHVVLFEEATGLLFSGDLYLGAGVGAGFAHEDPWQIARSLRLAAALAPRRLLGGHGQVIDSPAALLLARAARLERTGEEVLRLHDAGVPQAQIRRRLFSRGENRDRFYHWLTGGELSRDNFVSTVIRYR